MGEKTVIFVNSCIKFAALCGISGPAAFEPAHFFVSFLCANKEMKNTFTMLFSKAKKKLLLCFSQKPYFAYKEMNNTFTLLFSKAKFCFAFR